MRTVSVYHIFYRFPIDKLISHRDCYIRQMLFVRVAVSIIIVCDRGNDFRNIFIVGTKKIKNKKFAYAQNIRKLSSDRTVRLIFSDYINN